MHITSFSAQETSRFGRVLSRFLQPGDILLLFGDFGSGKTVFTKGVAQGLGIHKDALISPSFVLIREYLDARIPLYHFDLYRLGDTAQVTAMGYEEYLYGTGISVIEWAQRLGTLTPDEFLGISFRVVPGKDVRQLAIEGKGRRYEERAREFTLALTSRKGKGDGHG